MSYDNTAKEAFVKGPEKFYLCKEKSRFLGTVIELMRKGKSCG
jgi:hypothetical protein